MIQVLKKNLNSKFIQRSKIIFGGSIISQIITLITSLIITFYFNPEDLGLLGTLTSLISIIAGTLSFKFEVAIIQSNENSAMDSFIKSTLVGGFACTLFSLLCLLLPWSFSERISNHLIPFIFWCWGYCLFFNSKQLPFKFNHLKLASWGVITRSLFTLISQFFIGLLNPIFELLLWSRVTSDYVGSFFHFGEYRKSIKIENFTSGWREFLHKNSDHFFFIAPQHFCLSLSNNILIFFIEGSFNLKIVGFFVLAQRLIIAPLEIIGSTIGNISLQRFSELKEQRSELGKFLTKIILLTSICSIFISVIIWLSADFIPYILGPKWQESLSMIKSLIPFFISTLLNSPTTYFFRFDNKANLLFYLEIAELILKISILCFFNWSYPTQMVFFYGLISLIFSLIKSFLGIQLLNRFN